MVGAGDQIKQYLVIDLGTYIQYPQEDVRRMLTHEMAHVILNDSTAGAKATAIPRWLHEGLAQSVTGEGHEAVQKMFAYWKGADGQLSDVGLCDLDGAVDEFAHGPDNAYCYPEYYLAVQRLRQLGGPHTLPILLKGLREGMSINDLIERLAGLDAAAFQAAVQRYASDIFSGRRKIP